MMNLLTLLHHHLLGSALLAFFVSVEYLRYTSDKEAMPPKAKDTKARDVQVMNKRPAKKRRVVSDDDYEQDKDLSPLLEDTNTAIKLKRDIKGKVKASTSASTSAVSRFVKNDKQQIPKVDETNAGTIMPSQEEPERGDKIVSGVLTGFVDLPQKKKLPTIKKKTKPPGTIPSAAASTTPSANPSPPVKISTVPLSGSGKDSIPITTLNPSGSGDFDLRDSNTWQSLLGKVGFSQKLVKYLFLFIKGGQKTTNSGPRVGIEKR